MIINNKNMDSIKLTPEELDELKSIQTSYQDKTFAFGQLYIEKLNAEERKKELDAIETKLKQELMDTQKSEQQWMEKVSAKYGEGNLNIKDGTFTPSK